MKRLTIKLFIIGLLLNGCGDNTPTNENILQAIKIEDVNIQKVENSICKKTIIEKTFLCEYEEVRFYNNKIKKLQKTVTIQKSGFPFYTWMKIN